MSESLCPLCGETVTAVGSICGHPFHVPEINEERVRIELDLTVGEANMLVLGSAHWFHHMRVAHADEFFGGYVKSQEVIDSRSVWRYLQEKTGIGSHEFD